MALLNDSLTIRLTSPDFQEDWGTLGDPDYVVLTKLRSSPDYVEIGINSGSPQRGLLMEEQCGVLIDFRGRNEFAGHVYLRQGGVAPDAPMVVYARAIDEVLDNTLAWVAPKPIQFPGSWGGLYSSGNIQPTAQLDTAQAFPDPFLDPGHYMWAYPYAGSDLVSWRNFMKPTLIGWALMPLLAANLDRVGFFDRASLWASKYEMPRNGVDMNSGEGANYSIADYSLWENPTDDPPWFNGFSGFSPRFHTLRECIRPFQDWADANTDESFNLTSEAVVAGGAYGARLIMSHGEPEYPATLSVEGGSVVDGSWSIGDHTGSRVILGGPGEQEKRIFQLRANFSRERSGRVIEVFKDATGAKLTALNKEEYEGFPRYYFVDPAVPDVYKDRVRFYFDQQGARYLADASPETEVSVELQETETVYYGGEGGYRIGQLINLDLGYFTVKRRVEKVVITLTLSDGLTVTPHVGSEVSTSDEVYARALQAVSTQQRRDNSER